MRYSDIKGGHTTVFVSTDSTLDWGVGIIYANPQFAPHVDDFHLMSTTGRWDPYAGGGVGTWVADSICSPCIDRGQPDPDPSDPADELFWDWKAEVDPNGQRINMGAYGGTVEASMTCQAQDILPVIVQTDPIPASAEEACIGWIHVWFNTEMVPDTVEEPENWQLMGSGGDSLFYDQGQGEDNDRNWPILDVVYTGDGGPAELHVSDLPCGCLPADVYRLTARDGLKSLTFTLLDGEFPPGGTAADLPSGNGQEGGDFVATFEITNAPPAGIPGHATVVKNSQDNLIVLTGCDADNDPLTFEICWADPNNPGRLIHGQLEPGDDDRTDTWYYTPDTGYSGPDEFYFKAFDGSMYSGCTLFTIEVVPEPCDLDPTSFLIMDHFPGECLCPGTQISLTWDVINHGPGDTINLPAVDWYDRIYFSTDEILDSGDRLLGSVSVMRDQPLSPKGTYSSQAVVTLPDNLTMDGAYWLILVIDDTNLQVEENEANNTEVLEFCIKPFIQLTSPFCGIFVDPSQTLELEWTDVADNVSAYVNVALDIDVDPANGYTPLLTLAPEDIDGEGDSAIVDVPDLSPGIYHLYAWLSDADGAFLSCPSKDRLVSMYERALRVDDPIGDVVGGFGTGYEIYSIEIGITGDRMDFRVRTNFDPRSRGGDVMIEFGNELAAIAVESRQLDNGQEVISGDFYRDISLLLGRVVPWPYRIAEWQEWITGYSGISVIDDIICMGVDFALFGWLDFAACGGLPDCVGWTMWCGNDWVEIVINTAPTGDFNSDGVVDNDDLVIWQEGFGQSSGADLSDGDSDSDGDVDGNDFLAWQLNFASSDTPELPADFNSDGDVDNDDLGIWEDSFGTTAGANQDDGDADGDGDVDGNDFLAWQLNFGSNTATGSAAKSSTGAAASDNGGSVFLSTAKGESDSSNNAPDNSAGLVRSSVGNGQSTFALPGYRHGLSFESVNYAGLSLSQPLPKTNGNTTAWLGLSQFQFRDASRLSQRDRAIDAVMSRLDGQATRTDLEHIHHSVRDITLTGIMAAYDEMEIAHHSGNMSSHEITGRSATGEIRKDLETALDEMIIESMFKSRGLIRI